VAKTCDRAIERPVARSSYYCDLGGSTLREYQIGFAVIEMAAGDTLENYSFQFISKGPLCTDPPPATFAAAMFETTQKDL